MDECPVRRRTSVVGTEALGCSSLDWPSLPPFLSRGFLFVFFKYSPLPPLSLARFGL